MTDMTGNPHAGNTNDNILHALADNPPGSAKCTDTLATAHVQATLALAYEQRTANLLQVLKIQADSELLDTVLKRLGLRDD